MNRIIRISTQNTRYIFIHRLDGIRSYKKTAKRVNALWKAYDRNYPRYNPSTKWRINPTAIEFVRTLFDDINIFTGY